MLRKLFKSDLEKILKIENAVHVVPWTEDTFKTCFQASCPGWVIEVDNEIVGFSIVTQREDECHILNICITHSYQHQGYGRKLLEHTLDGVKRQGAHIAYLEVRRSNQRAISLYRNMGFKLIGERKEYYPTVAGREDALVFAKSLQVSVE